MAITPTNSPNEIDPNERVTDLAESIDEIDQTTHMFSQCLECGDTYDTAERITERFNLCADCQSAYGYR